MEPYLPRLPLQVQPDPLIVAQYPLVFPCPTVSPHSFNSFGSGMESTIEVPHSGSRLPSPRNQASRRSRSRWIDFDRCPCTCREIGEIDSEVFARNETSNDDIFLCYQCGVWVGVDSPGTAIYEEVGTLFRASRGERGDERGGVIDLGLTSRPWRGAREESRG